MSVKLKRPVFLIACLFFGTTFAAQKNILPIHEWVTSSGIRVLYVREQQLPMVDIQVIFDAGSARDNGQPGLAQITNDALNSGTSKHNVDDIATAFDDVGAVFSSAVNRDMAVIALRSLADTKFFEPAFAMFREVLGTASFPTKEFTRIKNQRLTALNEQEQSPASIAAKAFYTTVFDDHPYGHPISGTKESVNRFTPADLQKFYRNHYTASNALITIVGDIDQNQAKELALKLAAQLNKGQKLPPLTNQSLVTKTTLKAIRFPSTQTHVMIGQVGIDRKDPAYFPVTVGNYILGGGSLTSRLFQEVRDKRGLVYTVHSQFSALKDKGPFVIELQTRNSEALHAIKVVNDTLTRFINAGPSQSEMDSARKNLTQGFIMHMASNTAISAQLMVIGFYQLPLNYLDTYQDNISKVTEKEVKEVFQNIIHPNSLVTITVGNSASEQDAKKSK